MAEQDPSPPPGRVLRRVLVGGALAIVLGVYLARATTDAAGRSPAFFVDPRRLTVEEAPSWIPAKWIEEARAAVRDVSPFSVFDAEGTAAAERALLALGWVREVSPAGRSFPRTARLRVRVRRLEALVECPEGRVGVDAPGIRLPSLGPEGEAAFPCLPRIVATKGRLGAPPAVGSVWGDRRVLDGAATAADVRALTARRDAARVVSIDVTNAGGTADPLAPEIFLVTESGVKILWGRSSVSGTFGELSPEAKLEALRRIESQYPGLEGLREADLRFDRPVVVFAGQRVAEGS